ncbi:hypothetical protein Y1Q_0015986 [Alligator mississippiensis]|uniref:Uncharacterized protein n=1 Tax=Alligator mississippiensis TaxID=8496 RepID=A0A151MVC0_ALLMI|nr:hypothetical protein Y1Q_0015986 [Alligator mississippiensis]
MSSEVDTEPAAETSANTPQERTPASADAREEAWHLQLKYLTLTSADSSQAPSKYRRKEKMLEELVDFSDTCGEVVKQA